jgi:hypothetical protein
MSERDPNAHLIEWMEYRMIHGEEVLVTTYKPICADVGNEEGLDNWTGGMVNVTVSPKSLMGRGGKV